MATRIMVHISKSLQGVIAQVRTFHFLRRNPVVYIIFGASDTFFEASGVFFRAFDIAF
jgi:hypothetical protein